MPYSVYQHWDPLQVCVVGKSYPPEFYNWIGNSSTRQKFESLAQETEEDLVQLARLLQKFGVEVVRPEMPDDFADCWVNGVAVPPPVTPRDYFITIHDSVWVPAVPNRVHAKLAYRKQDRLSWKQFQEQDQAKHIKKLSFYNNIFKKVKNSNTPLIETQCDYISGCWVSRVGKDLFFATQTADDKDSEILNTVNNLFKHTSNHVVDAQGHGDAVYSPVCPGLIISIANERYKDSFPGWEVVHLPASDYSKHTKFQHSMKLNRGRWYIPGFENDPELMKVVETYFDHWVGEAKETVFGVNILCVDQKNIIVSEHNQTLEDACARHGVEVHVSPFRHKYFWDAGIHCLTNDLHRTGVPANWINYE